MIHEIGHCGLDLPQSYGVKNITHWQLLICERPQYIACHTAISLRTDMQSANLSQFPLWSYLTQPIGVSGYKLTLNPTKFWNQQKIRFIERCWVMTYASEEHHYEA